MTENLQRLKELAERASSPEAVRAGDEGFAIDTADAVVEFAFPGGYPAAAYCRAKVADLGDGGLPPGFAEAALRGNFFWRATAGAVLSLNEKEGAIYLTDRFDEGAFGDEASFRGYLNDFLRTRMDWRFRFDTAKDAAGKEAL